MLYDLLKEGMAGSTVLLLVPLPTVLSSSSRFALPNSVSLFVSSTSHLSAVTTGMSISDPDVAFTSTASKG